MGAGGARGSIFLPFLSRTKTTCSILFHILLFMKYYLFLARNELNAGNRKTNKAAIIPVDNYLCTFRRQLLKYMKDL
jgi:hypothetical protein